MTTTHDLPMLLIEVEVAVVERLTPSYVRVQLASPALADFGVDGPLYDQRIKLVFPNAAGELASFEGADASWFGTWLDRPVEERGAMRTYTVREVLGAGEGTRVVVDIALHEPPCGPGSLWAAGARVGDRLVLLGPRRGVAYGGIEFAPPASSSRLLLVGDETALPAIAAILADLPDTARGAAYVEVPISGDMQSLAAPPGVAVTWLPRNGAERSTRLIAAVTSHLGAPVAAVAVDPDEIDPDLWETPTYSSSGEAIPESGEEAQALDGLYAWIAGESAMVTALRRHLVRDLGVDRRQVAFMGYWRVGVSMKS
ncbi:siderophore-interacting protein [Nocardioides cavernaquae]|nr:siderophore-interacting protein [Nocardioides cavernaquae]